MTRLARLVLAACGALLAGCSSGNNTVFERMAPILEEKLFGGPIFGEEEPVVPARQPTRAELNQIPFALISLQVGENPPTYVVPVADNRGHLVYQDPGRRGVVMEGGLITATHGLGYNLDAVAHAHDDPVAVPTPLPQWPEGVDRSYEFSLRGQIHYEIAVTCAFQRGPREFIEIVDLSFEVVRVTETCANPERRFVNTYWVDPESGFIWRTTQWVGPRLSPMTVEIVKPYART